MGNLASRSLVLAAARLIGQGLQMITPILLVRLLTVAEFGRYRQFTVTGMFLAAMAGFAIFSSVNYFVARSAGKGPAVVTHACLLQFATSLVAVIAVAMVGEAFVPPEIGQYRALLAAYVLLYVNLEVFVPYWLARKRSDLVMLYSVGQAGLRLALVAGAAAAFADLGMVFVSMVTFEGLRALGLYIWLRHSGLLVPRLDLALLREQLGFIIPAGMGGVLYELNGRFGTLLVSVKLGALPLAIYSIAAYKVPVLQVVKQSISEAIFPEMVQRSQDDRLAGLRLWQRSNVVYLMVVLPVWVLLTYFAEPLIRVVFTESYVQATPYFQVLLLLMVRECFDFATPMRSLGVNLPAMKANVVGLAVNVVVSVALLERLQLWAPTIGLMLCHAWLVGYLGYSVARTYEVTIGRLVNWQALGRLLFAILSAFVVLRVLEQFGTAGLLGDALATAGFLVTYGMLLKVTRLEEFAYLERYVMGRLRRVGGKSSGDE